MISSRVKNQYVDSHESVHATPTRGRVKSREVTRVVSTSRDIARHAFEKSQPAPAMTPAQAAQVAGKSRSRNQKQIVLAQGKREKGATEQARQAE
jgi:hypothetical protein